MCIIVLLFLVIFVNIYVKVKMELAGLLYVLTTWKTALMKFC